MFWMTDGVMIGGLLINCPTAATIAVRGLACFAKGVNEFSQNIIFRDGIACNWDTCKDLY